jgi:thiamine biosynthesis lipoprotein
MGMPITVEIIGDRIDSQALEIARVFEYFSYVDKTFSTYKDLSEVMKINRGELKLENASQDVQQIFKLAEQTKGETDGYFDIVNRKGIFDPSGIVKGWAIRNAVDILRRAGYVNFYVDAGGDIQAHGSNREGKPWSVGIKNPFNQQEIVKVIYPGEKGVATSGTYIRGQHIYDPKDKSGEITDIVSLTVIGPDVYEADRFATAAFAMGKKGIEFIEKLPGFEGYMIDANALATMTTGFEVYTERPLGGAVFPTAKHEGKILRRQKGAVDAS